MIFYKCVILINIGKGDEHKMETNYDYAEEIEYITKRVAEEGSVSRYLEETYENKHEMSELVSRIVTLNEQFIEKMDDERLDYTNDDEHEYIAGSTGYSKEIIELVLWFSECYQMMNGNIIYCAKCQKCGNDELYIREEKGGLFCSFVECGKCGETYTYDQMWEYDDNTIPSREEEIPLRNVNEITTSWIQKAANTMSLRSILRVSDIKHRWRTGSCWRASVLRRARNSYIYMILAMNGISL